MLFPLLFILWYIFSDAPPIIKLPGPPGRPIIGNLQDMGSSAPHLSLTALAKKYGPVFVLRIFRRNILVVSGYDSIKEVLKVKGKDFHNRPEKMFRTSHFYFGHEDMIFANPDIPFWHSARKTMINNLKGFESGLEGALVTATQAAMEKLRAMKGKPVDMNDDLYDYAMKMMLYVTTGMTIADGDPCLEQLREMEYLVAVCNEISARGEMLDRFPFLRHFGHSAYVGLTKARELLLNMWQRFKKEHARQPENPHYKASFMHAIRDLQETLKGESGQPLMDDYNSMAIMCDLWFAGIITTSNNLYALINILSQHENIARKLQQEVDCVVPGDHHVTLAHKDNLHYTRAVIIETLRFCSMVNLGLPHATSKQTELSGAVIPEGTMVLTNLFALHHDEELWEDPWKFTPERFLDDQGQLLPPDHKNRQHVMAFGAGPRMCLGSNLALNRMMVYVATLIKTFNIEQDPDNMAPYDPRTYDLAQTLRSKPYKVKLIPRN